MVKLNLIIFNVWPQQEKQRAKIKEKIEKCVKEKLLDFCDVLNISVARATTKKVISCRIFCRVIAN